MRKIYNMVGSNISEAWIGGTAPIPAGWHLDVNTAMNASKESQISEPPVINDPPKKRGRPRKVAP